MKWNGRNVEELKKNTEREWMRRRNARQRRERRKTDGRDERKSGLKGIKWKNGRVVYGKERGSGRISKDEEKRNIKKKREKNKGNL